MIGIIAFICVWVWFSCRSTVAECVEDGLDVGVLHNRSSPAPPSLSSVPPGMMSIHLVFHAKRPTNRELYVILSSGPARCPFIIRECPQARELPNLISAIFPSKLWIVGMNDKWRRNIPRSCLQSFTIRNRHHIQTRGDQIDPRSNR